MLESPLGFNYPKLLHPVFPVAVSEVVVSLSFRPSLSHCLGFLSFYFGSLLRFFLLLFSHSASSLFIGISGHAWGNEECWSVGRQAPLPRCFSRFRWRGGWSASGFGSGGPKVWSVGPWHVRREAGKKTPVFLFSAMPAGGKKKSNSAVQNGTVWSFFFFFNA